MRDVLLAARALLWSLLPSVKEVGGILLTLLWSGTSSSSSLLKQAVMELRKTSLQSLTSCVFALCVGLHAVCAEGKTSKYSRQAKRALCFIIILISQTEDRVGPFVVVEL